jgi:hypothetical protein
MKPLGFKYFFLERQFCECTVSYETPPVDLGQNFLTRYFVFIAAKEPISPPNETDKLLH